MDIVDSDRAIFGDDEQGLILGPAQADDGVLVPRDGPQRLSGVAIEIYTGL